MAVEIRMPQFGVSMETGTITQWHKAPGDPVRSGEVLATIETEKLTNDVLSETDGVLLKIVAQEGEDVPIQGLMALVGAPGELLPEETGAPAAAPAPAVSAPESHAESPAERRVKASPLARKVARELGVDLARVPSSGTSGRVKAKDVYAFAEAAKSAAPEAPSSVTAPAAASESAPAAVQAPAAPALRLEGDVVEKLSGMRSVVARRMLASHLEIPPVTQTVIADVTDLLAFRERLSQEAERKYSLNDLILKATAKALRRHPELLVSLEEGQLVRHSQVNLGMAVALETGLIVPVIRDADRLGLEELSDRAADLAARAREGRLTSEECVGSTFTVSNLGMFGVDHFTPIINQPDAAILGVCAARNELQLTEEGEVTCRKVMKLCLTFDHRLIDGAVAARFQADLRSLLEKPMKAVL